MAYDLTSMIQNVRDLIKTQSPSQITDEKIVGFINSFYLYSLPDELQCMKLVKNLKFYTIPNRDTYDLKTLTTSPVSDVLNSYLTFNPPVYINGSRAEYYQNRELFLKGYDYVEISSKMGKGQYDVDPDLEGTFAYTIQKVPVLPNSIVISGKKVGTNGHQYDALEVHDDGNGKLIGDVDPTIVAPVGNFINYDTGSVSVSFNTPITDYPSLGTVIDIRYKSYTPTIPSALLYYDSKFILRPIPDKVYAVEIEAVSRPTAFDVLVGADKPELNEWSEYIAYGAALKILNRRQDAESVGFHTVEFKKFQKLLIRRTLLQLYRTQRAMTRYDIGSGSWNWLRNSNDWSGS